MSLSRKHCKGSSQLQRVGGAKEKPCLRAWRCLSYHQQRSVVSTERCISAMPTASMPPAGCLSQSGVRAAGRQPSLRAQHPPGPLATYQGTAQVTGLLKERSQDYFLAAATDVFPESNICCSATDVDSTPPTDCVEEGGATGCSASTNGSGALSSFSSVGVPAMVVTGVFDGHGGETSARYAREAIMSYIANDRQLHQSLGAADTEATAAALRLTFRKVDYELLDRAEASSAAAAASASRPPLDEHGQDTGSHGLTHGSAAAAAAPVSGDFRDGTTALVTIQLGGLLAVANAGDSRAVLSRQGEAVRLSRDHTPALRAERERIEAAGGQVVVARGAARVLAPLAGRTDVMKALSVSRSLGDPDFKASGLIISDPDVSLVPLQQGADSFLIAASDGLWGRVADQEAVDCVNEVLEEYSHMTAPLGNSRSHAAKAAAQRLLRLALDQGSVDDVTVVVCVFAWGK